jgi:hypothetical protein
MELSCIMNILPCYLVYPCDGFRTIECLCLVNRPSVEVEWLIAAHDRAPSRYGGSMWIMLTIGFMARETGWGN